MPGTTSNGYPTMLDSDPLADVALAIRDLAQAADDKAGVSRSGHVTVPVVASDSGNVTVTFPVDHFGGPPHVVASTQSPNFYARTGVATADDVVISVHHRDGTSVTTDVEVDWIAHRN